MEKFPAVIINTPNSTRYKPLLETLQSSNLFEPVLLPAIMGGDLRAASEIAIAQEQESYGRSLTQNERACAVSHERARQIIADSARGGLIFEDDARINDLAFLEMATKTFLLKYGKSASALGLLNYSESQPIAVLDAKSFRIHPLLAEAPLTVATVLTPWAAAQLVSSSRTRSQTADWPRSQCKYHFLSIGCVQHGDEQSGTVIGEPLIRIRGKYPKLMTSNGLNSYRLLLMQKLDTYRIKYLQS